MPISIRLHLEIIDSAKAHLSVDSPELYPHTGQSWRLLAERFMRPEEELFKMANFTTYDDSYIYNTFAPKSIFQGQLPQSFASELKWQTDANGAVFSEELTCHQLND